MLAHGRYDGTCNASLLLKSQERVAFTYDDFFLKIVIVIVIVTSSALSRADEVALEMARTARSGENAVWALMVRHRC